MAKGQSFTFISCIVDKSGNGSVRCRKESVFEQMRSPKGTYQYKQVESTEFMPEEEQFACDKKMMEHAAEILSEYLACHPEESI